MPALKPRFRGRKRVAILFTPPHRTPHKEFITYDQVDSTCRILNANGFDAKWYLFDPTHLDRIVRGFVPDVIFNLTYGYVDKEQQVSLSQASCAARLESYGVPVVGSTAAVQEICQDKRLTSQILETHRLSTPGPPEPLFESNGAEYLIRKPRRGACHRNVRLVHRDELPQGRFIAGADSAESGSLIYENYCHGREFTVAVLERAGRLLSLPPLEVAFDLPERQPRIKTWQYWPWRRVIHDSDEFGLCEVSKRAFSALRMKHYARFDFKVVQDGPVLLDANSLPNMHPTRSFLPAICSYAGMGYAALILCLVNAALYE